MRKGAKISTCGQFRYQLWRIWDETKPLVLFIMLNPSTADSDQDDPTIRRLIGFCHRWGAGGFFVGNLNPYRTSSPSELMKFLETGCTQGERIEMAVRNQNEVKHMAANVAFCVAAWGAHIYSSASKEPLEYKTILGDVPFYCLGLTKGGYPRHPLYLPYSAQLLTWPDSQPIEKP
ncbi:DUF1643 domain-containing protein [Chitinophaga lutea]|uniref:DUF1643 domain-containing protein n=1 Tax=Chitinophaga lutea TaxID=2488634 RepID=A0A3N4PA72_9BACT|nr:DUF1643 domain-containing protein [Chitinophaga lutea]RPE05542.1 DUF1643 domain-containing protein [Chitinophaga lutea]